MELPAKFLPARPRQLRGAPVIWSAAAWLIAAAILVGFMHFTAPQLGGRLLPGPAAVIERLHEGWTEDRVLSLVAGRPLGLAQLAGVTAVKFVKFLACGVAIGIGVLLLAALSERLRVVLRECVWLCNPVPPLLAIPLLHAGGCTTAQVEWIGGSFYPALAAVSIGLGAIETVPASLDFMVRQAGASRTWRLFNLQWPMIEATILPSFRVHGSYSLGILLVLQWLLSDGLGRGMKHAMSSNDGALLLACVVLAVAVAAAYEVAMQSVIALRLRWLRTVSQ